MEQSAAGAVQMQLSSLSPLRMRLSHGPSGVHLETDAPKDNGGDAASFSPTDLLAASLMACMVTTMALAARREGVPWGAVSATVEKRMAPAPRRVGQLVVAISMPKELPADRRAHFENVARTCPVQLSLSPDVKVDLAFRY